MYLAPGVAERASVLGPLAVATPGLVAGLALVQERWGRFPLARVMQPAIRLAEQGFAIGPYHARMLEGLRAAGLEARLGETARIQFPPQGARAEPGWRLRQPDLARTLRRIAERGRASSTAARSGPRSPSTSRAPAAWSRAPTSPPTPPSCGRRCAAATAGWR